MVKSTGWSCKNEQTAKTKNIDSVLNNKVRICITFDIFYLCIHMYVCQQKKCVILSYYV